MSQWPVGSRGAKGSLLHNDDSHGFTDPNGGGSPLPVKKFVPFPQRGGVGHQGRDRVAIKAKMGGGRSGSGNPALRGGFTGEARGGSFQPEARINGHGGSPQVRERSGGQTYGGFGTSGQVGVPTAPHSNPPLKAGNTSGTTHRQIAGRFQRKAMGARATKGGYGAPPVTANT